MFILRGVTLLFGLVGWAAGTLAIRLRGQGFLHPGQTISVLVLYGISFLLMAGLAYFICRRSGLPPEEWPVVGISLAIPTLVLDSFSSAFFSSVFPNVSPAASGLFGGWMLCSCAGLLLGATMRR